VLGVGSSTWVLGSFFSTTLLAVDYLEGPLCYLIAFNF